MNDAQLAALAAELTTSTHPTTDPYNVDNTLAAAEIMAENITRIRDSMTGSEIWELTDMTEFNALATDILKDRWISFCAIETHDPVNNGKLHTMVTSIFPPTGDTRDNMVTARSELVSQATILGLGSVNSGSVAQVRGA